MPDYTFTQTPADTAYLDANTTNTTGSAIELGALWSETGKSLTTVVVTCKATTDGSGSPQKIRAVVWTSTANTNQKATTAWSSDITGGDQQVTLTFSPSVELSAGNLLGFEGNNPNNNYYVEIKCNASDSETGTSQYRIYTGSWESRSEGNLWMTLTLSGAATTSTLLPPPVAWI
jgi:hypothetical protein